MQVVEEVSEDEDGSEAEVCHSVMLDYKGPGGETYVTFHESLVFLFGVSAEESSQGVYCLQQSIGQLHTLKVYVRT